MGAEVTLTENGAISNATTSSALLDYFAKAGTYTDRKQEEVNESMISCFAENKELALKLLFGIRLVTRKFEGLEDVQTGYGRRDEFYKTVVWLSKNYPEFLYKNLHLIPVFGCWKDLLQEPLIDSLDKYRVYELVKNNMQDQLLRKYLPQIRSNGNLRTDRDKKRVEWAKGLCKYLQISKKDYRKLKSAGEAHVWQKQMSSKEWGAINFNGIPGKAMLNHTSQKGRDKKTVFERHGQVERLKAWAEAQTSVKFTGYPYQLLQAASKNPSIVQKVIYNKQFESILNQMKSHKLGNVLACLDTSGSMSWQAIEGTTALEICLSMGLVFSSLNVGYFKDAVVKFDSYSNLITLKGDFCERISQVRGLGAMGSTNFQSVIDLIVRIRKEHPEIPLNEYPETLLVVSDMQFNPVGKNVETNYEATRRRLNEVGLEDIRVIWWNVTARGTDFPSTMNDKGVYMISGFDPVNLKSLMGLDSKNKDFVATEKKEQNPMDGLMNWLSQPIFQLIKF